MEVIEEKAPPEIKEAVKKERGPMGKVIVQTPKWKVMLKEKTIEVELYDLVFSDREVMSILDAYKKAVDIRHWEVKKFGRAN